MGKIISFYEKVVRSNEGNSPRTKVSLTEKSYFEQKHKLHFTLLKIYALIVYTKKNI